MIFFKEKKLWIVIILFVIMLITLLLFNNQYQEIPIKKLNKRKKIHTSKNIKISSNLSKKLKKKLNNVKYSNNKVNSFPPKYKEIYIPTIINNNIQKKYIIKLYFATWCSHCNNIKPLWESLKNKYNIIDFQDIDCSNNNPTESYITGLPTIVSCDNNNNQIYEVYEGNNNLSDIENFIKKFI